jgi:hypothetical protein
MNAPDELILDVLVRINEALAPYRPLLVMMRPPSSQQTEAVIQNRGADWQRSMEEFMGGTAYGLANRLEGYEGLLRFLDAYSSALNQWRQVWPHQAIDMAPWEDATNAQVAQIVARLKGS